jgi:hypothetical protein
MRLEIIKLLRILFYSFYKILLMHCLVFLWKMLLNMEKWFQMLL